MKNKYSIKRRLIFCWFVVSSFTIGSNYLPDLSFSSANANEQESFTENNESQVEHISSWLDSDSFSSWLK